MKRLLSHNPETGRRVWVDEGAEASFIREEQDIQAMLEDNKRIYNATDHKSFRSVLRKKNIWRAAFIPNIVVEQWMREGINVFKDEDWPKIRKRLNDPEYLHLRTSPGKV